MIRELRKNITLGGLRIKDLITEGRKYWMPAHSSLHEHCAADGR